MVGPTLPHWTCSSAWEEERGGEESLLWEVEGAPPLLLVGPAVAPMSRPVLFRFPITPVLLIFNLFY